METPLHEQLQTALPAEWRITHLIELAPSDWQCNITDDESVCVGTGESPNRAIADAGGKAATGHTVGRLFSLGAMMDRSDGVAFSTVDLRSLLGLNKPRLVVNRRI